MLYLNAFSTAAVALFAFVEVWRGRRDRSQRARVAHARLANLSKDLHEMVKGWNLSFPVEVIYRIDRPPGPHDAGLMKAWVDRALSNTQALDDRILNVVDEAAAARWRAARAAEAATVSLGHALRLMRELSIPLITQDQLDELMVGHLPGILSPFDVLRIDAGELRLAVQTAEKRLDELIQRTERKPPWRPPRVMRSRIQRD